VERQVAYRDSASSLLDGDWLGAFAQPGVILNTASAMSVRFDDTGGAIVDEYGDSTVTVSARTADRIAFTNRYARAEFNYVGRIVDGQLAGYWYSPLRPSFAGVFWMSRVDRLAETSATALRDRVRSKSPRRAVVLSIHAVLTMATCIGMVTYLPVAVAALAISFGFDALLRRRVVALRCDVDGWKQQLG
jgi:hypothetical protein